VHSFAVVDELDVNVLVAEEHRHPRPLRGSDNFLANAPFAQLPKFFLFRLLHDDAVTDLAVT
jgi:hypothetical protein